MDLAHYEDAAFDYIPTLARRLRRYGITQYALAKAMGRSPSQVNRWLRGRRSPTLVSVGRIEHALASLRASDAESQRINRIVTGRDA